MRSALYEFKKLRDVNPGDFILATTLYYEVIAVENLGPGVGCRYGYINPTRPNDYPMSVIDNCSSRICIFTGDKSKIKKVSEVPVGSIVQMLNYMDFMEYKAVSSDGNKTNFVGLLVEDKSIELDSNSYVYLVREEEYMKLSSEIEIARISLDKLKVGDIVIINHDAYRVTMVRPSLEFPTSNTQFMVDCIKSKSIEPVSELWGGYNSQSILIYRGDASNLVYVEELQVNDSFRDPTLNPKEVKTVKDFSQDVCKYTTPPNEEDDLEGSGYILKNNLVIQIKEEYMKLSSHV